MLLLSHFFQLNDSTKYIPNNEYGLSYLVSGEVVKKTQPIFTFNDDGSKHPVYSNYFIFRNTLFLRDENNSFIEFRDGKRFREYQLEKSLGDFRICWTKAGSIYLLDDSDVYELLQEDKTIRLKLVYSLPEGEASYVLPFKNKDGFFIGTKRNGLHQIRKKQFRSLYHEPAGQRNNLRNLFEIGLDSLYSEHGILYSPNVTSDLGQSPSESFFKDSLDLLTFNWLTSWFSKPSLENEEIDFKFLTGTFIKDKTGSFWCSGSYGSFRLNDNPRVYPDPKPDTIIDCRGSFYNPYTNQIWTAFKGKIRVFSIADKSYRWLPGFENYHTRNIIFQSPNLTWLCIIGKGLYSWDGKKLTAYPLDKKQSLKYCHTIVEDEEGFLWISTDNGILKAYPQDLENYRTGKSKSVYYHRFDKKNGFLTNEFNGSGFPCGLRLSTNKIAFASLHGAVIFDPKQVLLPYSDGKIVLDQILIDNVDTLIDLQKGLDQTFEQLEFKIAYSYFGDLENIPTEYRIEGLQEKWTPVPEGNSIRVRLPDHGQYNLIVRKHNGFGSDNFSYLAYPFTINPKFYETFVFKLSMILLLMLLITGGFVLNNLVARRKRKHLEEIIREKTQDQLKLNEELKLNLAKVRQSEEILKSNTKMKDRFIAIYVHDVRGPLRFVKTIISNSIDRIDEIDQANLIRWLQNIKTSTNQVYQLTEHMFNWIRSQKEQFELKTSDLPINKLIKGLLDQFSKQAENKNILLEQIQSGDLEVKSDENVLTIVLSNIIDNAIKFTKNGSILIRTYELDEHIVINVTDNGVGMDKEKLAQMRKGVFSTQEGTEGEKGTGFGLKTISELLLMINGYMEIESEVNKGTSVSIFLKKT